MPRRRALVEAEQALFGRSPVLDSLIEAHGPARLPGPAPAARRFHDLAESIAYQQLHGAAAAAIWGRVRDATGENVVGPEAILGVGEVRLRSCGLSGSKTRTLLALADRVAVGDLTLDRIGRLDDEAVIDALTPTWGIGRWTAQMFLMFTLGRLDVWPAGDYGVRHGYAVAWDLAEHPAEKAMPALGEPFAGGRSLVAWYCWRAADSRKSAETGRS